MRTRPPKLAIVIALAQCLVASNETAVAQAPPTAGETERNRVVHLLNRIAYGPRPGDVDRVLAVGIPKYIDQQLHPEQIPDTTLERRLGEFQILNHSPSQLARIQRAMLAEAQRHAERPRAEPTARPAQDRLRALVKEFQTLPVLRAVLSERQLYEVMVDFWTNHFNVYMGKGHERVFMPSYLEETIRPNALGTFEELLVATAQSSAMLFYLDNYQSVAPGSRPPQARRHSMNTMRRSTDTPDSPLSQRQRRADSIRARQVARFPTGLNENYARELLELHTLGVDGGYTEQDVVHVARIFTGWSTRVNRGGPMVFLPWAHDSGGKTVLGRVFPPHRGMEEGLELLRMLADHPATRRHVSAKLCARFVNDTPPRECVDEAAEAWERSDGSIREVVRAILVSDAFWDEPNRAAKFKTPLEFVASAFRILGADLDPLPDLATHVATLGQPLFWWGPPNGYPEDQASWMNAGSLVRRFVFAQMLATGRLPGTRSGLDATVPLGANREVLITRIERHVLQDRATPHTRRIMREQSSTIRVPATARAVILSLALGSPEFQRQ